VRSRAGRRRGRRFDVGADRLGDARSVDRVAPDGRPRAAGDGSADDTEPEASERITLIEFTWMGFTGPQPVILVAREWLQ
jgi:hypothetical protein